MKGIQSLLNDSGEKTSVLIDLEQWGDLWDDFYDVMVYQSRQNEAEIDWEVLEAEIPLWDIAEMFTAIDDIGRQLAIALDHYNAFTSTKERPVNSTIKDFANPDRNILTAICFLPSCNPSCNPSCLPSCLPSSKMAW